MQMNLASKKSLSMLVIACLHFVSGCVVINNQDLRPSVMEKSAIRTKCLSYIYGCSVSDKGKNKCTNETVNPKETPTTENILNKNELMDCMTHYHEKLRSRFLYRFDSEYTSPRIEKKLERQRIKNELEQNRLANEKSPNWLPWNGEAPQDQSLK